MTTTQDIADGFVRLANELKAHRTLLNGNLPDLSGLNTTAKTNFVAAINELQAEINALAAGSGAIDDGTTGTSTTWSSQKVTDEVAAAVASILGGAGAAYDTLQEIKALLDSSDAADDSALAALTTAVGNRLRFDATQTLTSGERAQANANLGSVSVAEFGSRTTNYVALIETALA